jgi:hypothetical protein
VRSYRETTIRIHGLERVIRTEQTGTVKQLEAAHTKAVKAAVTELHAQSVPAYAARVRKMDRAAVIVEVSNVLPFYDAQKLVARNGGAAGAHVLREGLVTRYERRKFTVPGTNYTDARKPFPKVKFNIAVTDPLVAEFHEYITPSSDRLTSISS